MTDTTNPHPGRNRNRMLLLVIFAMFFGSMLVAGALRFSGWRPAGMKNHGELLQPPVDLRTRIPRLADGGDYRWNPTARIWRIVLAPPGDCTDACAALARDIDVVWKLMGRNADRSTCCGCARSRAAVHRRPCATTRRCACYARIPRCARCCRASMPRPPPVSMACRYT